MGGMIENLLLTSHLHNLPEIHHRHIVADEAHNAEIMGDEKIGQSHLFLHILQNGDNLWSVTRRSPPWMLSLIHI